MIRQVDGIDLPDFSGGEVKRYRICFRGRVQRVGFRLEVCQLAGRLGMTGWCKNLENGDVLAEIQGDPENSNEDLVERSVTLADKLFETLYPLPETKETNN